MEACHETPIDTAIVTLKKHLLRASFHPATVLAAVVSVCAHQQPQCAHVAAAVNEIHEAQHRPGVVQ